MRPFLLDSNFFIQAHRDTYPLDVASSFWDKLAQLALNGKVLSIDKVHDEICDKTNPDILAIWCSDHLPSGFFLNSAVALPQYMAVIKAAESRTPTYTQRAKDEFYDEKEADAWLIAHAMASGYTIVTHETSEPIKIKKVKIPDICSIVSVKTVTTIQMFRELGEKF